MALRGLTIGSLTLTAENIFFIIRFYAIVHTTTIVQNKIISIICSWPFLCPANIYRPSLGQVWLGRPNPKPIAGLNFYLRRRKKRPFYSELYALQRYRAWFSILIFMYFLKKITNFLFKNVSKFWTIYIIIIFLF